MIYLLLLAALQWLPVNPASMVHAEYLLMSDGEAYEPDVHRLHLYLRFAAIRFELLEPQNADIYFRRGPHENLRDPVTIRERRRGTEVKGGHWARFGVASTTARQEVERLNAIRNELHQRKLLFPDRQESFEAEMDHIAWYISLWSNVGYNSSWAATRIRDHLTDEEWAKGLLPYYVGDK